MKKTHICPKCGGKEIYHNEFLSKLGERVAIAITSWSSIYTSVYICISCGYFEEYIAEQELKDKKIIDKIKSSWKKIG